MLAVVIILIVITTTFLGYLHGSGIIFTSMETDQDWMLVLEALGQFDNNGLCIF